MEALVKCIYCNTTENLTVSDIIPFALTGAKLKKRFVCKKHNSHTNNEFEKECIKGWDFFRNQLGFRTRDGELIKYRGNIVIDDIVINNVELSSKKHFYTNQILSTTSNGHRVILGNSNLIKERLKVEPQEIDNNTISMEYKFSLNELIVSPRMRRTIAKIAYEWHCYKNDINEYQKQYDAIVTYILHGHEQEDAVECVVDAHAFTVADQLCEFGTNSIYEYIDHQGSCYVIFNFWNVVIYKVRISQNNTPVNKKENLIEMERYNADGTKDSIAFGVYSLNGGLDVISEPVEDAMNRLHDVYLKNLEAISTHTVLTVFTLKQMLDDLMKDIEGLENEKLTIADFLEYEEWKRIILIQVVLIFSESGKYDYNQSFNSNLQQILGIEEFFKINKDEVNDYTKKIVSLFENGFLVQKLRNGLDYFEQCYLYEMDRINNC